MSRASRGQSVLSRVVRILETFDEGVRDLSGSQIARRAGMPLSTTHQLLQEMDALGLVERLSDRRYRIGIRLWELAVRTPGALGLREVATPYLRKLHESIGQNLQLVILQGADALFIERMSAPGAAANVVVVGGRLPFYSTSSGLLLAAFTPPAQRAALIEVDRQPYARAPLPTNLELDAQLNAIRAQRYAITRGYIEPSVTAIAVPVFNPTREAVAAVSAIVPTENAQEERVLATLFTGARDISAALGRSYAGTG